MRMNGSPSGGATLCPPCGVAKWLALGKSTLFRT
jgi:hypothetical protein